MSKINVSELNASEVDASDVNLEGLNDDEIKEVFHKYVLEFIKATPYPTYDEIYNYIFYVDKMNYTLYGALIILDIIFL